LTPIASASAVIAIAGLGHQVVGELERLSQARLLSDEEHLAEMLEDRPPRRRMPLAVPTP
jgi:hypothetical protein